MLVPSLVSISRKLSISRVEVASASTLAAARNLLCGLWTCLGDVERYAQLNEDKEQKSSRSGSAGVPLPSSSQSAGWSRCIDMYGRALAAFPGSGKAHNQVRVRYPLGSSTVVVLE